MRTALTAALAALTLFVLTGCGGGGGGSAPERAAAPVAAPDPANPLEAKRAEVAKLTGDLNDARQELHSVGGDGGPAPAALEPVEIATVQEGDTEIARLQGEIDLIRRNVETLSEYALEREVEHISALAFQMNHYNHNFPNVEYETEFDSLAEARAEFDRLMDLWTAHHVARTANVRKEQRIIEQSDLIIERKPLGEFENIAKSALATQDEHGNRFLEPVFIEPTKRRGSSADYLETDPLSSGGGVPGYMEVIRLTPHGPGPRRQLDDRNGISIYVGNNGNGVFHPTLIAYRGLLRYSLFHNLHNTAPGTFSVGEYPDRVEHYNYSSIAHSVGIKTNANPSLSATWSGVMFGSINNCGYGDKCQTGLVEYDDPRRPELAGLIPNYSPGLWVEAMRGCDWRWAVVWASGSGRVYGVFRGLTGRVWGLRRVG